MARENQSQNKATTEHVLSFEVDGEQRAITALDQIEGGYKALSSTVQQQASAERALATTSSSLSAEQRALATQTNGMISANKKATSSVDDLGRSLRRTENYMDDAARGARNYEEQIARARSESELFGDVGSRISAGAGLAGNFVGGEVGGNIAIAADLLDAVEAARLMRAELPALVSSMMETGPITTGLVSQLDKMGVANSKAAVGVVAVTAAIAAVATAIIMVGDFGDAMSELSDLVHNATEASIESVNRYWDFMAENPGLEAYQVAMDDSMQAQMDLSNRLAGMNEIYTAILSARESAQGSDDWVTSIAGSLVEVADEGGGLGSAINWLAGLAGMDITTGITSVEEEISNLEAQIMAEEMTRGRLMETRAQDAIYENEIERRRLQALDDRTQAIANSIQLEARATSQIESWSSEQVQARLTEIETQRAITSAYLPELEALAVESEDGAKQLATYNDQLAALDAEQASLENTVMPLIAAREAETAAVERQQSALERARDARDAELERISEVREARADLIVSYQDETEALISARSEWEQSAQATHQQKMADLSASYYTDLSKLEVDYRQDQVDAFTEYEQDLSDAQREAESERLEAELDYYRDNLDAAEDHKRRLEDIDRSANRSMLEAARSRDAVGIEQARRQGEEQREDAARQYEDETEDRATEYSRRMDDLSSALDDENSELRRNYQRELSDLQQSNQRQRSERQRNYQQALTTQRANYQRQITEQRAAWSREDQERQRSYQAEMNGLQIHNRQLESERQRHMLAELGIVSRGNQEIERELGNINWLQTPGNYEQTYGTSLTSYGGHTMPGFANGGWPPLGTPTRVGELGEETAVWYPYIFKHGQSPPGSGMGGSSLQVSMGNIEANVNLGSGQSIQGALAEAQIGKRIESKLAQIIESYI